MKKIYLLIVGLLLTILLQAQVVKRVELTSGTLTSLLTVQEKNTITSLTLIGTVDARDFITTSQMPLLTSLDLSQTKVTAIDTIFNDRVAISHTDTIGSYGYNPRESGSYFSYRLTSLKLPLTLKAIDVNGLSHCSGLTSIEIPSTVTFIGLYAFWDCSGLTSLNIPSSVTYIETDAFHGCSGLKELTISSSITTIKRYTFAFCTSLITLTIPNSVTYIEEGGFMNCTALTTVIFPESLRGGIDHVAFLYCPNITSIYSYSPVPPGIAKGAFDAITSACTVYVPYGSGALYAAAEGWKDFEHIVEALPGFSLSATSLSMEFAAQSMTVELKAQTAWTAKSDQSWLTVSPLSGTGSQTLTLSANENTTYDSRTAKVTVTVSDTVSKDITVVQTGKLSSDTIHVETAGTLYAYLNEDELVSVTHLTLTGEIDARDFKLIRDKILFLEVLDLSGVSINAYSGTEGTNENITDYKENEVPPKAFDNSFDDRKSRLTTVVLPETVTVIGEEAFSQCRAMKNFEIPSSVTAISYYAFAGTGITSLIIPSSITTIGIQAFRGCKSLKSIELPSSITELGNAVFEACDSLTSVTLPALLTSISHRLFYSCIGLKTVDIGLAITAIEDEAFFYCTALDSIKIPASVTRIGYNAFTFCYSLSSIYSYPGNPPDLSESGVVFSNVDLEKCILYVPAGTKELYASASRWKDFQHIVEMGEFSLDATTVSVDAGENSEAMVKLYSSLAWTATSDQEWLTVAPGSGSGGKELTLTARANPQDIARTAIVTIAAEGAQALVIHVTQLGMTVGLDDMENSVKVSCYPNPFTQQLTIEVANSSLQAVSVEIFTIGGLKIKTLPTAPKKAKTSVSWNGKDDQGKKVPGGMYLLRVNGETRKVMKE